MPPPNPPDDANVLVIFPLFIVAWLLGGALLAHLSGWRLLAKRFRATEPVEGLRCRFSSGRMGRRGEMPVGYGSCLNLIVGRTGFRLSILFPFRFFCPPLFIPWTEVESVEEKRDWFRQRSQISIRGSDVFVAISGHAGECIAAMYAEKCLTSPKTTPETIADPD